MSKSFLDYWLEATKHWGTDHAIISIGEEEENKRQKNRRDRVKELSKHCFVQEDHRNMKRYCSSCKTWISHLDNAMLRGICSVAENEAIMKYLNNEI